jgi:hypothetical protein
MREVQMGAIQSPAQSKRYAGLLPVELSVEAPAVHTADLKNDWFANERPSSDKRTSHPLARFLITFYVGVAATVAWQSYSDAARQIIARLSPQLGWLAPQTAVAQTGPDPIEQITRSVDRIVATSQDQITRSVDQLAAGQEKMTRELIKLQAISQYGLYKNSEPPPRPAPAPAVGALTARSGRPAHHHATISSTSGGLPAAIPLLPARNP